MLMLKCSHVEKKSMLSLSGIHKYFVNRHGL